MKQLRFFGLCLKLTLGRLCQQRWLLAGLVLLCLFLPLGAGRAAGYLLTRGTGFSGVVLAVTAPEGDGTPELLVQYMGGMEDISQYCQFRAMEEEEALSALRSGEAAAILALPEDFIRGVMRGDNPDLRLIAAEDQPLESLLLLWVGQSACDILSAFQSGVYAVLDLYEEAPPPGLERDQVVFDINLRYIRLTLDRGSMFGYEEITATGTLPILPHYALALLTFFALSSAPVFVPIYSGDWLSFQRRLRCAGRGCLAGWLSGIAAGAAALFLLLAPGLVLLGADGGSVPGLLGAAILTAAYCSLFCGLCCLAAASAAGCGAAAFGISLLALALAGGIVPPALMPAGVRRLSWLSPVTWLQRLAAWPMGYGMPPSALAGLTLSALGMGLLSLALYRRRADRQEGEL